MPRVIIVHGWADDPGKGWLGWLASELEREGVTVKAPRFPRTSIINVDVHGLLDQLREEVGEIRPDDVIVAHSMGVPLTLRILSDYEPETSFAGLVMVAGVADYPLMRPNPVFDPPLNFAKIIRMARKRISMYSDNDRSVPIKLTDHLAAVLQAEKVLDPGKGHFAGMRGVTELPSALAAIRECLASKR